MGNSAAGGAWRSQRGGFRRSLRDPLQPPHSQTLRREGGEMRSGKHGKNGSWTMLKPGESKKCSGAWILKTKSSKLSGLMKRSEDYRPNSCPSLLQRGFLGYDHKQLASLRVSDNFPFFLKWFLHIFYDFQVILICSRCLKLSIGTISGNKNCRVVPEKDSERVFQVKTLGFIVDKTSQMDVSIYIYIYMLIMEDDIITIITL